MIESNFNLVILTTEMERAMCNERNAKKVEELRNFKNKRLKKWVDDSSYFHRYAESFEQVKEYFKLFVQNKNFLKELADEYGYNVKEFINNNYELYKKYANELLKELWNKIEKERPLLEFVKSSKVNCKSFSEISYFGKINWNKAKEFADNNSDGWRLPDIKEADDMIKIQKGNLLKDLCGENSFHFWTKFKCFMIHITGGHYEAYSSEHCDYCVFYVR